MPNSVKTLILLTDPHAMTTITFVVLYPHYDYAYYHCSILLFVKPSKPLKQEKKKRSIFAWKKQILRSGDDTYS